MTTITTDPSATRSATCPTVDRFLAAVSGGAGIPAELYGRDAVLDATVPNWRFSVRGGPAIAAEYDRWFAHEGSFEELERHTIDGGEVVNYVLVWRELGVPHAAHHCHVLTVDEEGLIARDKVFCGGRWSADLLAQMAAADAD